MITKMGFGLKESIRAEVGKRRLCALSISVRIMLELLSDAIVAWEQPWTMLKWMGVSVLQGNFIYKNMWPARKP